MLTAWILLLAFLLLVAANALFVAVEFSFLTVDREAVRSAAASGDKSSTSTPPAPATIGQATAQTRSAMPSLASALPWI